MIFSVRRFRERSVDRPWRPPRRKTLRMPTLAVPLSFRWTLLLISTSRTKFLCSSRSARTATRRTTIWAPMSTVRTVASSLARSIAPTSMVMVKPSPRTSLRSLVSSTTCGISPKPSRARRWRSWIPRSARLPSGRMVRPLTRCAPLVIRSLSLFPRLLTVQGTSHDLWIDSNVGRIIMSDPIIEDLTGYFVVEFIGHFDYDRYYLRDFIPVSSD